MAQELGVLPHPTDQAENHVPVDVYDLNRFVQAQNEGGTYDRVLAELRVGHKRTHWIWFIFPQLADLGRSPTARRFGIRSLDEAVAYLRHPVLGSRLVECAETILGTMGRSAEEILGPVDAQKLRSCMTLFVRADPTRDVFARVLEMFYGGTPDPLTDRLLAGSPP